MSKLKPLLSWPGGKRNEIKHFEHLIPSFSRYVEPFFGGGALYWHLAPRKAVICDKFELLIDFYRDFADNSGDLYNDIFSLVDELTYKIKKDAKISANYFTNRKDMFLRELRKLNAKDFREHRKSAIFYFLLKQSVYSLFRYNPRIDKYNVSFMLREAYFKLPNDSELYVDLLNRTDIICGDYSLITTRNDDFVFLDPPYLNNNTIYKHEFDVSDDERLHKYFLTSNGKVMMILPETDDNFKLYGDYVKMKYDKIYFMKNKNRIRHMVICNY